jgi:hypothetical protein
LLERVDRLFPEEEVGLVIGIHEREPPWMPITSGPKAWVVTGSA